MTTALLEQAMDKARAMGTEDGREDGSWFRVADTKHAETVMCAFADGDQTFSELIRWDCEIPTNLFVWLGVSSAEPEDHRQVVNAYRTTHWFAYHEEVVRIVRVWLDERGIKLFV